MQNKCRMFFSMAVLILGLTTACTQATAPEAPAGVSPVVTEPAAVTSTVFIPTDTSIPATDTPLPLTDTPIPPTETATLVHPSPTEILPFVIVRLFPSQGALEDQLTAHAQEAAAQGLHPFAMFDANW